MRNLLCLLLLAIIVLPHPAGASQFGAIMDGPVGGWLLFICALAALLVFAAVCRQGSVYLAERTHASRIARLMDVLANQADGLVEMLLSHPPAAGEALQAVRQAGIAQIVAYAKINLPGTVAQIGVSDAVMAARVDNYVSEKMRDAPAAVLAAPVADAAVAAMRVVVSAAGPQPAPQPAA